MPVPVSAADWPAPPVVIRKLDKKRDWQPGPTDLPASVEHARRALFDHEREPEFSVYLAANAEEFQRVVVALNATRSPQSQEAVFVLFSLAEVEAAGIKLAPTLGTTPCRHANLRHRDLTGRPDQFDALCRVGLQANRNYQRVVKSSVRNAFAEARVDNCHAAGDVTQPCRVTDCPPDL